jgi:hypothetical protein
MLGESVPGADPPDEPTLLPRRPAPAVWGVLVTEPQPRCLACGQTWQDGGAVAEDYSARVLHLDWYTATDGAEPPVEDCPECGETAAVWDETGSVSTTREY